MQNNEEFMRHWTKTQPVIAGYIASIVSDIHEQEDVLQNVAVVLIGKFSEYDSRHSFVGWALGIAKREVLSRRRKHARDFLSYRPELVEAITEECEALSSELEQREKLLRECMGAVQGRSSQILKLRYESSLKTEQIASKLGLDGGAVRTALSRIREALQNCVSQRLRLAGSRR
jgi:RNA polymerase sigma-70 factor (ECF subfamily)